MKFINLLFEDFMPKNRGETKIINTKSLKRVMYYEVTDNVN